MPVPSVTVTATRATLSDLPTTVVLTMGTKQGTWTEVLDGNVDYFAGGMAKPNTRDLDTVTSPITFLALSWTQVRQLRAWRGKTLLLRTVDGERRYGVFYSLSKVRQLHAVPVDGTDTLVAYNVDVEFLGVSWTPPGT